MDAPEPMFDPRLADQWFADSNPEDQALDRTMVARLGKDIGPRVVRLKAMCESLGSENAKAELHGLRGAVSSIGLLACAQHLRELEKNWTELPAAARLALLAAASDSFNGGLAALLARFPHLR